MIALKNEVDAVEKTGRQLCDAASRGSELASLREDAEQYLRWVARLREDTARAVRWWQADVKARGPDDAADEQTCRDYFGLYVRLADVCREAFSLTRSMERGGVAVEGKVALLAARDAIDDILLFPPDVLIESARQVARGDVIPLSEVVRGLQPRCDVARS